MGNGWVSGYSPIGEWAFVRHTGNLCFNVSSHWGNGGVSGHFTLGERVLFFPLRNWISR